MRFVGLIFVLLNCFINLAFSETVQPKSGYQGFTWNSSFPLIEKQYPNIEFLEENNFHVVLFSVNDPNQDLKRLEFRLFEEQLFSVANFYDHPLKPYQSEAFLRQITTLGKRKDIRKTTTLGDYGDANVLIWEYENLLVFYKSYVSMKKTEWGMPENSIHFIWKPTFKKMFLYRQQHLGDPENEDVGDAHYVSF